MSRGAPNPALQGTLRDKASRSVPDLERSGSPYRRMAFCMG